MKSKPRAKWYAIFGTAGLLCGCAATSGNRGSSGHPLTLTVQVEATERSQVGSRPIAPNETLHSGDTLSIKAKVDQPAYVYAVLYSKKGWSTDLSPQRKLPLVQPGSFVKMPEEDVPTLDDEAGDEQLIVVALPHPIDEPTCALLRMRCPSRTEQAPTRGGDSPPPPPPPPPPPQPTPPPTPAGIPASQRGGRLVIDAEQHQVQVQSDATGIALLRFPFKHAP